MRILRLQLRGAIGIKKGLGVDEIEIDFTQFQPGLIALTGRNGSGKTTIMENLHPYRMMVSRDGSLQTHFFLKDSYRILEFEFAGKFYKSQIYIDALTGGSEAYLFEYLYDTTKENNVNAHALNDGKLTTYDKAIEDLLGTPELFFNSVFSGQKSKGIAALKPVERRKLFYELLNLNSYEEHLERAKAELKQNELRLAEIEGQIKAIKDEENPFSKDYEGTIANLQNKKEELSEAYFKNEPEIDRLTDEIQESEINLGVKQKSLEENKQYLSKALNLEIEIAELSNKNNQKVKIYNDSLTDATRNINSLGFLLKRKDEIETVNKQMDDLEKDITRLNEERHKLLERNGVIQKEYSDAHQALKGKEAHLQELERNKISIEHNLNNASHSLDGAIKDSELIDLVPCDEATGSKCTFLSNAYASKKNIDFFESEEKRIELELKNIEVLISQNQKKIESEKQLIEERYKLAQEELSGLKDIDTTLAHNKAVLSDYQQRDFRLQAKQLLEAENEIKLWVQKADSASQLIDQARESFDKDLERIKKEIAEANSKYDAQLESSIEIEKNYIKKLQSELEVVNSNQRNIKERIDSFDLAIAENKNKHEIALANQAKVALLSEKKTEFEADIRDWNFLCKAFDKTGIPVLKLENSGIEITSIANNLLSLFENKFRIVFETTSLTKDKKKTKETFDINIIEEDGVCEIGNKSGGQQVWLETAIQLAIMILLIQQGKKIETSFLDEKDGALDLENAFSYIEMLKKAHQLSGVYNTFIITHRTELLDFIPQQVKLTNGILEVIN